jgi:hypothetical protein
MITAADDGWVRTQDDLRDLLTYAVPGARVQLAPIPGDPRPETVRRTRRVVLSLDRVGGRLETTDLVSLPVRAEDLARRARQLADAAMTSTPGRAAVRQDGSCAPRQPAVASA